MRGLAPLLLIAVVLLGAVPRARAAADADAGASQILRATLDNGLKVVIVRNTLAPVVTTAVNYLTLDAQDRARRRTPTGGAAA